MPSLCQDCCMGKLHRLLFIASLDKYIEPLQLHRCLEPGPVTSDLSHKYYVCFIDAFSRYTCIYLLVTESHVFRAFL